MNTVHLNDDAVIAYADLADRAWLACCAATGLAVYLLTQAAAAGWRAHEAMSWSRP